jgi:CBS domain-containing protein
VVDRGHVRGVVTAADLLGLEAGSPIALRHIILGAADEHELQRAVEHLPNLFRLLMEAGVPSSDIGRVLTLQHDAVVTRLIDFAIRRHGSAPLAWAWLDLGSAARREFTLGSDQDNALAFATPPAGSEREVDDYFARLGSDVNTGLARMGIGVDNNGVLAGERLWRMSKDDWLRTFREVLSEPDESHLIRATVVFDFRSAAGGLAVAPELTEQMRSARQHPQFMRLLARNASGFPVSLTFRGHLATDKDGRLDLKRGGITPLVNLVRFHALAQGVTISPTLDRINAVESMGGLSTDAADALRDAFGVVMRVRFEHHAAAIAAGQTIDNLIDPGALSPIVQTELREALGVVKRGQRQLGAWTPATSK